MTKGEDLIGISFADNGGIGQSYGLTKREYFAALILQGMHASTPGTAAESCVFFAVKEADKLIEELNKDLK